MKLLSLLLCAASLHAASVVISGDRASGSVAASTGLAAPIALGQLHQAAAPSTETATQAPWRTAGVFSKLFIHVSSNDRGTSTLVMRKGGTTQNLQISISGTGEFKDDTHTDTATAGDPFGYLLTTGSGGTSFVDRTIGIIFAASSNTATRFGGFSGPTTTVDSTDIYQPITGQTAPSAPTSEADAQFRVRMSGTIRNLQLYISGNSRATATTLKSRINGADGLQSISIIAGAVGSVEDTTHTDSVAANDLVCSDLVTGSGGGAIVSQDSSMDLATTTQSHRVSAALSKTVTASTTGYYALSGNLNSSTTESDYQMDARMSDTFGNLQINVITNTVSAASTLTFRKGAADGSLAVSITSLGSGQLADTTHTDAVVASDLINYKLVTGGTGTSLIFTHIGVTSGLGSAPSVVRRRFVGIGG